MRLNLLFVAIDALTLMIYPFVYLYSKLQQFSNSKEGSAQGVDELRRSKQIAI